MKESGFLIREAEVGDAPGLLTFLQQVGGESENLTFDDKGLPVTEIGEREYLASRKASHNTITLLALKGERIVGSLGIDTPSIARLSHRGEVGISVIKEFWGQGVGSALLEAMFSWLHEGTTGLRKIDLSAREDNERAIALYVKFGFTIEGKIRRFVAVDGIFYDGLAMGLLLD